MRIDPLTILLNKDINLNKKFYLISGNESSLIEKIRSTITKIYQRDHGATLIRINSVDDFIDGAGLFENEKIFLISSCKGIDDIKLNNLRNKTDTFIFIEENSRRIKALKSIFLKNKDSFLIDCYEIDRASKIKILNEFLKFSKLKIDQNIYWFLVEKLNNKYVFIEDSLNKLLELEHKDITLENVKKILTLDNSGKEKLFFNLFKRNREIIEAYRESILNTSDVNEFYYFCKFHCQLIVDCENLEEYRKKIPIYLFKEKGFLIDLYKKYNSKKKKLLLTLLSSSEKTLRNQSSLSVMYGLRFLLNIKKITIS